MMTSTPPPGPNAQRLAPASELTTHVLYTPVGAQGPVATTAEVTAGEASTTIRTALVQKGSDPSPHGNVLLDANALLQDINARVDSVIEMQDSEDDTVNRWCFCTRCRCPGGACCRQTKDGFACRGCCKCCCRCTQMKKPLKLTLSMVIGLLVLFVVLAFAVHSSLVQKQN